MSSTYATPESVTTENENMEMGVAPKKFLPVRLWSIQYLLQVPGAMEYALDLDEERVASLFASQTSPSPAQAPSLPTTSALTMPPRIAVPPITPFDGSSSTLRAFCSQLVNQINSHESQFPTEISKVQFAYQCLGPRALVKMRSLFRCLEDPSIPAEINTLSEFLSAMKQRCQDPGLCEKASRTIDSLYQQNMNFHEFITIFEDNMTDSTYGKLDKANWKVMLERRLSTRLRNALVTAHGVPDEYHSFVAYLRQKDAAFQEINATKRFLGPVPYAPQRPVVSPSFASSIPTTFEPTVSQGGSAMDLDMLSREKGPDGRLTIEAKNARRTLGRCLRCNKTGHLAINCPLGNSKGVFISNVDRAPVEAEQLKD